MLIEGQWYDQGSAARSAAALHLDGEYFTIIVENGKSFSGRLNELKISDRLGNVERKLTLEDGSVFATNDNDAIDKLFKTHNKVNRFIHFVESNIAWVVFSLLFTIAFSIAFVKWGVPWISTKIAHALPHKTNELIAGHTLEFLDDYLFEESTLDSERMEDIRTRFKTKLIPLDENNDSIDYTIHFRAWDYYGVGIPNALALPSGDLILTDEFVELSETPDEIDSVLLHEMGHVVHRHSLEMIIESTMITAIVMLVTGDSNGLADMGIGLGTLLVSSNYSRGHESEADEYAFEKMLTAKIDPNAFADIMKRITMHMEEIDSDADTEDESSTNENKTLSDYLSSHPSTAERIERARRYSLCFQEGLSVCEMEIELKAE